MRIRLEFSLSKNLRIRLKVLLIKKERQLYFICINRFR